jgi:hypothetical protein
MPVRVYWEDEPQTIVRYDFDGPWTWDDLYPAYYQAIQMERSVEYRVDVILDLRHSGRMPANVLLHIKNISEKQPPNLGLSVFVTTNTFMHSLYQTGIRFYNKIGYYFRMVKTLDEAHSMIAQSRLAAQANPPNSPS